MSKASILTEADVIRLRELASRKILNTKFEAQFYGVGTETIRRAVRGETWTRIREAQMPEQLAEEAQASLEKLQSLIAREKARLAIPEDALRELGEEGLVDREAARKKGYL